jgi:hypothetical protein
MYSPLLLATAIVVILVVSSIPRDAKPNKDGFLDYIIYGPGPWWYRPYGHRIRFMGPCPGAWCPYR